MNANNIGFAMCGSFCTFPKTLPYLEQLVKSGYHVTPILSGTAASTDTRFGAAEDYIRKITEITGKKPLIDMVEVEPFGPKRLLDVLVVAPCTGNTLAKIARGISDSTVSLACKAHLRNGRPVVLALFSNDALSGNAVNVGSLLVRKNIYFVPFKQDDPLGKPCSLAADLDFLPDTIQSALNGRQYQPILA